MERRYPDCLKIRSRCDLCLRVSSWVDGVWTIPCLLRCYHLSSLSDCYFYLHISAFLPFLSASCPLVFRPPGSYLMYLILLFHFLFFVSLLNLFSISPLITSAFLDFQFSSLRSMLLFLLISAPFSIDLCSSHCSSSLIFFLLIPLISFLPLPCDLCPSSSL